MFIPFQIFLLFMWWFEQAAQQAKWYRPDGVSIDKNHNKVIKHNFSVSAPNWCNLKKMV
mgnify:CR=1 FL=1